jgi:PQQ-dependent catabolism-associated CXXCW motif protein
LAQATAGDPARPLVFFCQRACWMSWNAAKRALSLGYTRVNWYPDGTDGWSEAGLPLARIEPAP